MIVKVEIRDCVCTLEPFMNEFIPWAWQIRLGNRPIAIRPLNGEE